MARNVQHRTITPPQRFRFVQDDSGHWYAIPADRYAEFNKWVESFSSDLAYPHYKGPDFDEYRLSGGPESHTFTDLKEDQ